MSFNDNLELNVLQFCLPQYRKLPKPHPLTFDLLATSAPSIFSPHTRPGHCPSPTSHTPPTISNSYPSSLNKLLKMYSTPSTCNTCQTCVSRVGLWCLRQATAILVTAVCASTERDRDKLRIPNPSFLSQTAFCHLSAFSFNVHDIISGAHELIPPPLPDASNRYLLSYKLQRQLKLVPTPPYFSKNTEGYENGRLREHRLDNRCSRVLERRSLGTRRFVSHAPCRSQCEFQCTAVQASDERTPPVALCSF